MWSVCVKQIVPGLAKIVPRYCQELQDVMIRSYQETHVPKKKLNAKSYLVKKKSGRKSTKINIFADLYCYTIKFLLARYKV